MGDITGSFCGDAVFFSGKKHLDCIYGAQVTKIISLSESNRSSWCKSFYKRTTDEIHANLPAARLQFFCLFYFVKHNAVNSRVRWLVVPVSNLLNWCFHVVCQAFICKSEYRSDACRLFSVLDNGSLSCSWLYFTNKSVKTEEHQWFHMLLDGSRDVEENGTGAIMAGWCDVQHKQFK